MANYFNFKEENIIIRDSFKIDRNSLQSETNLETKTKPRKMVEKFRTFHENTFLQQQITDEGFILLKLLRSYTADIELRICNYTHNYTAMTVTMYYYYNLNNRYNSI